ncbi:hypothetical protein KIW84_073306 [Lathyrus oleraceus]|uniref:Gamma carbonic anhydrase family protein n=1 Tax=Pisum sativum TaxID=3888 RepID=A0A9D4ZWF4_PEA|nr:hypothetical protein KIW84_073306 [Pisum sativum]
MNVFDKAPVVDKDAFIAPSASVISNVHIGRGSSIWYGCVMRGYSSVLHGCTVEDEAFVGMGATLLDGVVVEKHSMVAVGALVKMNSRIPSGEIWARNPAKFLKKLTAEEISFISQSVISYSNLAQVATGHSPQLQDFRLYNESFDHNIEARAMEAKLNKLRP